MYATDALLLRFLISNLSKKKGFRKCPNNWCDFENYHDKYRFSGENLVILEKKFIDIRAFSKCQRIACSKKAKF